MHLVQPANDPGNPEKKELIDKRRRFQLARLITLSEEMLDAARESAWEKVEELEILRRVELDECFTLQNNNPSLLIAQALATLVHINEQIVYLVKKARAHTGGEEKREYSAHKAAIAYNQAMD